MAGGVNLCSFYTILSYMLLNDTKLSFICDATGRLPPWDAYGLALFQDASTTKMFLIVMDSRTPGKHALAMPRYSDNIV